MMAPTQIAERLDQRLRLLTGGGVPAVERHRTLQATVSWSYELLEPIERAVFQRLAIIERLTALGRHAHRRRSTAVRLAACRCAHNAVRYAISADQHRDPTVLNVHPADAASNAITDGAAVRVRSGTRTITASALLNRQNRGRYGIAHARRIVAQVAELIDPTADRLTGQPVFTGFPITIEALAR